MTNETVLRIDGEVECPAEMSFADLEAVDASMQVADVSRIDAGRAGDAVKLEGILNIVRPRSSATYLTLHASADDFHASIPLEAVRDSGVLIYRCDGAPLTAAAGGPIRFLIPDAAECHTDEIDDCANVKFVDRIELSQGRGHDNRPTDDTEHEALHEGQRSDSP